MELEETNVFCPKKDVNQKLKKVLDKNRFLLVIDGEVRNSDWNTILDALPEDHNGSRIICIMQGIHKRPPPAIDKEYWIELECFEKEDTSSLCIKRVCMEENFENQIKNFDVVLHGITIGLPLAIVLLSGLIKTKEYPNEWQAVFEHLESKKSKRLDSILAMCFDDLPHDLKSCFLYFAALPMNTPVEARKLVCMWMEEGFLRPKYGKTMEKVGIIYLKELVMRHLLNMKHTRLTLWISIMVTISLLWQLLVASRYKNYTDKYAAMSSSLSKLRSILSNFQEEVEVDEEEEDNEESDDNEDEDNEESEDDEEDSEEEGDIEAEQKVEGDGDGEGEEDENNEIVLCADNENNGGVEGLHEITRKEGKLKQVKKQNRK
ncbi:unnamed protein product [Miscanthus lutarioriparius]|uniref:NB-ARC domain-containing protein n=1 Tax=Miscanthus lutarioriparius TaxID=422564 RepID=A0A811N887_9POAL|nr:unnamed protein product [Miscanthus lutarioriparius]